VPPVWETLVGKLGREENILAFVGVGSKPFAKEILRVAVDVR
jgi:hypothetical protein